MKVCMSGAEKNYTENNNLHKLIKQAKTVYIFYDLSTICKFIPKITGKILGKFINILYNIIKRW